MNLVDAIRKAAVQAGVPTMNTEENPPPKPVNGPDWEPEVFQPPAPAPTPAPALEVVASEAGLFAVSDPAPSDAGPGLVRVEFHLPPEQIAAFFKAVSATQHPVLTLREAATQLRVSSKTLQTLAEADRVPAFQVDGRWRFAKIQLDAWIAQQQEGSHAA